MPLKCTRNINASLTFRCRVYGMCVVSRLNIGIAVASRANICMSADFSVRFAVAFVCITLCFGRMDTFSQLARFVRVWSFITKCGNVRIDTARRMECALILCDCISSDFSFRKLLVSHNNNNNNKINCSLCSVLLEMKHKLVSLASHLLFLCVCVCVYL